MAIVTHYCKPEYSTVGTCIHAQHLTLFGMHDAKTDGRHDVEKSLDRLACYFGWKVELRSYGKYSSVVKDIKRTPRMLVGLK